MDDQYLYLILNLGTISIPLLASFHPKANFSKTWKAFFPAVLITGTFFIIWDVWFTHFGIWGFNPRYLTGIYLLELPIEEWLFFFTIPYACVFTYFSLNYLIKKDLLKNIHEYITIGLTVTLLGVGVANYDKFYTASAFILTALVLAYQGLCKNKMMGRFYLMYFLTLIPFFIVNGILTGSGIEGQVVWYDNLHNLGFRLGTIPIEDTIYGMLLLLMNVAIYDRLSPGHN